MRFRSYDSLRIFDAVARSGSVTRAAKELHQSKGAVSYQVRKLETDLGFTVFDRSSSGLELTDAGTRLWHVSQASFGQIEREINALRGATAHAVTVGMLSYFSSRWLSPRLGDFFHAYPGVSLRVESLNSAESLTATPVDIAILWGVGGIDDLPSELLVGCPAVPVANAALASEIERIGIENAVHTMPLLGDSSGDVGWRAWHTAAGIDYKPSPASLTVADSSSRVQAVVDGQGLGLWDVLVTPEVRKGNLVAVSDVTLEDAGYYLITLGTLPNDGVQCFVNWLREQSKDAGSQRLVSASSL